MTKKQIKFVCLAVAVMMITTLAFTGCTTKEKPEESVKSSEKSTEKAIEGKLKVIVINLPVDDQVDPATGVKSKGMIRLFEQFTERYPGVEIVNSISQPWSGWAEKVQTLLLSNDVDVLLASVYDNYAQGLILNLNELIQKDEPDIWDKYIDGVIKTERVAFNEEHIIGLPGELSASSVAYDKKLFEDWGVEPLSKNPTPEEILEKAKKLTGKNPKTGKQNYGIWFNGKSQNNYILDEFSHGFSLGEFNRLDYSKSEVKINTPENKKKIEKWMEYIKYMHPGVSLGQGAEKWGTEDNDIAIRLRYFVEDASVVKQNNAYDRFVTTEGIKDKNGGVAYNCPMAWSIAKNSEYIDAAWEFIKYCSGYEGQKFVFENYGRIPSIKNIDFINNSNDPYVANVIKPITVAATGESRNPFFPPFLIKNFRPFLNDTMAKIFDGETIDLDKELVEQQKACEEWAKEQKPLDLK